MVFAKMLISAQYEKDLVDFKSEYNRSVSDFVDDFWGRMLMSQIIGLGVGCDEILSDSTVQMFVASPGWRTASQSVHQNMVGKNFGMFSQGDSWCLKKTLLLLCRIDMEAMS